MIYAKKMRFTLKNAIYAKKNNAPMRDACVAKPFVNV